MAVQSPKKSSALPWPALIPLGHHAGKPAISLQKMVILVGSRHNAHLHLLSRHVSKAHALILSYGGSVYIRDLASREQVYINGVPEREAWLQNGDLVKIGSFTFKYKEGPTPGDGPEGDAPPHQADIEISGAESPLAIAEKVMLIGRRSTCDVSLMEASVSTAHAVIFHVGGVRYVRDLGSRTGTWVNGTKVHQHPLSLGDSIRIGETEMHYALSSEHEHAISPVLAEAKPQDEIDELEDLVGTAPLDMAAEIRRDGQILPSDLEADLRGMFGAGGLSEATPARDDDLIELEIAHEPQAEAPTPQPGPPAKAPPALPTGAINFPRPQPKAAAAPPPPPIEEPIELEPEADEPIAAAEPASAAEPVEPEFTEIDLSKDPDIFDIPSAADTRAIGMEFHAEPVKPTISDRVVDALPEPEPEAAEETPVEHAPLDVDAQSTEQGVSEAAAAEATPLDATWPDDLLPIEGGESASITEDADAISPRGGWQGMSRPEIDALPPTPVDEPVSPVEESLDEVPPAIAEITAPEIEAPIAPEPILEAPVVESPVEESQAADEALAASLTSEAEVAPEPIAPTAADFDDAAPEVIELPTGKKGRGRKIKAEKPVEEKSKKGKGGRKSKKQQELEQQETQATDAAPSEPAIEAMPVADAPAIEEAAPEMPQPAQVEEPVAAEPLVVEEASFDLPETVDEKLDEAPPIEQPAEFADLEIARAEEASVEETFSAQRAAELPIAEVAGEIAPLDEQVQDLTSAAHDTPAATEDQFSVETVGKINSDLSDLEFTPAIKIEPEIVHSESPAAHEPAAPVESPAAALPDVPEQEIAASASELADALEDLPALDLGDLDDLPPLEAFTPEAIEPEALASANELQAVPADAAPQAGASDASDELEEHLEELSVLEEDFLAPPPAPLPPSPAPEPLSAPAPAAEDDFFAGMEETLPVLELDSGDLGPMTSDRDPDALLALDQIDLDGLEDIEVIESTEPTLDSALNLNVGSDPHGDATNDDDSSLTDSSFGRQVEAFTATTSGDIVEDLPEIEAIEDADEELAIALGDASDGGSIQDHATARDNGAFGHTADITAGSIEPAAMSATTDPALAAQQFEAAGDAVALETPGVTEADAVVGGQAFVADANGQEIAGDSAGELDDQSFVAHGDAHAPEESFQTSDAPEVEPIGAAHPGNGQSADDPGAAPPAPRPPRGSGGGGGGEGFVIGTDLSSFIGGMPLVLPDLAPPPTAFGRVQVSFAGAKAPWEQAKRPSFPMGQSLAQDVTDAAEGLRDVESMDEDPDAQADAAREQAAATDVENELDGLGEGAPGDEWNVAAALEDDEEEQSLAEWPAPPATDLSATEAQELTAHASPETLEQLQREIDSLEELIEPAAAESLEAGESVEEFESLDEDELLKELDAADLSAIEPISLDSEPTAEAPAAHDAGPAQEPAESPGQPSLDATEAVVPVAAAPEAPAAEAPQPESPVDRSPPPPPVAPPKPAAGTPPPMVVPPPPARVLRGGRKGAEAQPPTAPPLADSAAADDPMNGDAIFGSMEHGELGGGPPFAGVREVDVFSQGSPGALDFNQQAADSPAQRRADQGGGSSSAAATENRRPQRVIVPPRMGVLGAGAATIENDQPGEPLTRPTYRVIPKKNIAKRVLIVVLLMLVCMGLAIAGIFYFMHPKQTTSGDLQFQKIGALTKLQRDQLRREQFEKLGSPRLMVEARTNIAAQSIPAGFLADPIQFARGIKPEWPDERPAVMTVAYTGPADPQDRQRLHAVLMAMFTDNHADLDREIHLKSNIAALEKRIEEVKTLKAQRDQLRKAVDAAPGPDEIQKLEAKSRDADSAYDMAVAAVKDAQLAVRSAEEQLPPTSPGERSLNAGDPQKKAAADAELAALQKSLDAAAAQAAAVKGAASEEADAKRKMLDQAIELFQQSAADLMKEDPQLARYVQSVQQLQEQTHRLSGDLIEVQQQQHKRLSALKKDMDDRVQDRRTKLWAEDKSLGDLRAQLDLAQRKYNAANDSNYATDSPEIKRALADIRDLTGRIEARKMALGNDPIVTSVADGLQEMINITKERLEADRARIEKDIKNQELAFAQSNMVEKLPDTQRAQAAALKAKQEAINDLRKQYAGALDKRTAESNVALRDLEGQVSSVTAKIDERKRLLAADNARNLTQQQEADRKANLEKAQAALKQADDRAATARQAYAQASRALTSAAARTTERTEKQQQLEAIDQSLAGAIDQSKQDERALESLNDQLKTLVTIVQPAEANIRVEAGRDDRWPYAAGAAVGLAVLFGIVAVFSVAGGDGTHRQEQFEAEAIDDNADAGPLAIEQIGPRPGAAAANRNAQSVAG